MNPLILYNNITLELGARREKFDKHIFFLLKTAVFEKHLFLTQH